MPGKDLKNIDFGDLDHINHIKKRLNYNTKLFSKRPAGFFAVA